MEGAVQIRWNIVLTMLGVSLAALCLYGLLTGRGGPTGSALAVYLLIPLAFCLFMLWAAIGALVMLNPGLTVLGAVVMALLRQFPLRSQPRPLRARQRARKWSRRQSRDGAIPRI